MFINAVNEVVRERAQSFLEPTHIEKIASAYKAFVDQKDFCKVATTDKILSNGASLSIPLYVRNETCIDDEQAQLQLEESIDAWIQSSSEFHDSMKKLFEMLEETPPEYDPDGGQSINTQEHNSSLTEPSVKEKEVQPAYLRSLLAAEIVFQNYQQSRFGSVKLEKILYLCDAHFGLEEKIDQHYLRQAAGPYDPKGMRSIKNNLVKHKWFNVQKVDHQGTKYLPMDKCGEHKHAYERYFSAEKAQIQSVLNLMKTWKTQECEIIATLYFAWADFLAEGTIPGDTQIVNEVFVNWNDSKMKIAKERWYDGLKWMKGKGLYPGGSFGKEGVQA